MFPSTVENSLVLSLFQLLFAGLVLFVLCALVVRNSGARRRPDVWLLAASFLLLSAHLLFKTLGYYFAIVRPQIAPVQGVHILIESLEALAFILLIPAYFIWGRRGRE